MTGVLTVAGLAAGMLAALAVAAFCAGAETGFLSASRDRILHLARSGGARAKVVQAALADLGATTTALLVGNNLAAVCFSSASAALCGACCGGSGAAETVWSGVAACVMLYFGEFLPKLLCAARPVRRLLALTPCWRVFRVFFGPAGALVLAALDRVLPRREAKSRVTPETVLRILEDRRDGVRLSEFESALIGRLMVLRSKGVKTISPEVLLKPLK